MKEQFNAVVMPYARYVAPDGSRHRIARRDYVRPVHKDHLICLHCEAKVHFHPGATHKDAGNRRQAPHFHTNAGQKHDQNCSYGQALSDRPRDDRHYDDTRGYRLNLDMGEISRCPDGGHRTVTFKRHDRIWPEQILAMRPIAIRTAKDFAERLGQLDPDRLRRSVVLWHDRIIPFQKFFIRGNQRSSELVDKLRERPLRDPVMMYVHPQGDGWKDQTRRHEERLNYQCGAIKHPQLGSVSVRLCLEKDVARAGIESDVPVLALCRPNLNQGALYIDIDQISGVTNCDLIDLLDLKTKLGFAAPPPAGRMPPGAGQMKPGGAAPASP